MRRRRRSPSSCSRRWCASPSRFAVTASASSKRKKRDKRLETGSAHVPRRIVKWRRRIDARVNEGRPEAPQGLRVRARAISGLGALESLGVRAAVQAVLLGPERFDALRRIDYVEPLLLRRSIETEEVPALERVFARCSDIYAHLPTLYRLTVDGKRKRTLELGTRDGDSTIALLLAAREIGGTLTSVDLEPCPIATARVDGAGLRDLWTFVQQDDLGLDWDRPIDHLFVDTSHRYSHTIDELRKYEPFVV